MTTTGAVTVDLNNFSSMVNNSSTLGASVITGVSDQGSLIGLAIGITIAIGLLFGVIFFVIGYIIRVIRETKGLKSA